jgi:hypothetical protein
MVPIAYMPSPIPRQVEWNLFARTIPFASAFPRNRGGSAPASLFSGPAQRSLTLRPARSPSRLSDPLHQRLQRSRCLHRCSDCYRVERTSSRAGIPPLWTSAFTAHPVCPSGSYRVVARIEIPSTATATSAAFHNQVSGSSSLRDARQRPMLLLHSVVVKNATRKSRVFHVNPCATRFLPNDCSQDFMQITDPAGL